ncbi:MAG: dihydrofolate reductase family protein [Bacteroidetes bacterium]|nr:dihydrofolate reductase family protein [Bacteroidota bacterium]
MRKIILYIAQSLDGYIAKSDGDVSWLEQIPNPDQSDYGYRAFYDTIDTTLMGRKTFDQICSFDIPFPYADKTNYVFTHHPNHGTKEPVNFVSKNPLNLINNLKKTKGKNIWLVGGSQLNTFFLKHQLIDALRLFIMPVVLGSGIPLFHSLKQPASFELIDQQRFSSGVVELIYQLKKS